MSGPAVSVVIPTHNRFHLLPRAIDSVVAQTVADWEIVLVDDGSTDDTPALAERYATQLRERWVYLRGPRRGSSAARNRGIDAARAEFVAFLDSDDEFAPRKLERQLTLFRLQPQLGLVYSDFSFIDLAGAVHASVFEEKFPIARAAACRSVAPGLYVCTQPLFDTLIRGYFIATIVGMIRRTTLGSNIRFRENLSYAEEWLFFLEAARAAAAGFVDEPLSIHHFTAGSLARTDAQSNLARYTDVLRAILTQFPDLTRSQRAGVRANLAQASRQLAYGALKDQRPADALSHFATALRQQPRLRSVVELLHAATTMARPASAAHPQPHSAR